jgi:hypothetical protein
MSAASIRRLDGDIFEPLYCQRCGEVIGVYEPLVVTESHRVRVTSRAAEPTLPASGVYSHHSCTGPRDAAQTPPSVSGRPARRSAPPRRSGPDRAP